MERELLVSPAFVPCRHIFQRLLDQEVARVSIEPWSVWLLFCQEQLHIEGDWRLIGQAGRIIDRNQEFDDRQQFELWRIAGQKVIGLQFADEPLRRFVMQFTGDWSLEVAADDDGLEDWSLVSMQSGGSKVYCNGATITVFS